MKTIIIAALLVAFYGSNFATWKQAKWYYTTQEIWIGKKNIADKACLSDADVRHVCLDKFGKWTYSDNHGDSVFHEAPRRGVAKL